MDKRISLFSLFFLFSCILILSGFILFFQIGESQKPFDKNIYVNLLERLRQKHKLLPMRQYFSLGKPADVAVLTHDVDYKVEGLKALTLVEKEFNVRSTIFIRFDAYYLTQNLAYFQQLEREGWEIGFHYDSLSRTNGNMTEALKLFQSQLAFFRSYFNISSVSYHGDVEYDVATFNGNLYLENIDLFHEWGLRERLEVEGEYIADTNHNLKIPQEFESVVVVNFHSDWWS